MPAGPLSSAGSPSPARSGPARSGSSLGRSPDPACPSPWGRAACPSTLPARGAGRREARTSPELHKPPRCWPALGQLTQASKQAPKPGLCSKARTSRWRLHQIQPQRGPRRARSSRRTPGASPDIPATSQLSPLLTPFSIPGRWQAASPSPAPAQLRRPTVPRDHIASCNQAAVPALARLGTISCAPWRNHSKSIHDSQDSCSPSGTVRH